MPGIYNVEFLLRWLGHAPTACELHAATLEGLA